MPNCVVVIKSCHKHAERRKAVSETWLPGLDWAAHTFLIGNPCTGAANQQGVWPCPVSDDFKDIAPKIKHAAVLALEGGYDYMFVCDDDTYVRTTRLFAAWKNVQIHGQDYVGHMRTDGLGYNQGIPYAQGAAYFLSARAMEYVATSKEMVPGIIDDGAVGRALDGQVPFTHDRRYMPGPVPNLLVNPDWISVHKCLPNVMQQVHEAVCKTA